MSRTWILLACLAGIFSGCSKGEPSNPATRYVTELQNDVKRGEIAARKMGKASGVQEEQWKNIQQTSE